MKLTLATILLLNTLTLNALAISGSPCGPRLGKTAESYKEQHPCNRPGPCSPPSLQEIQALRNATLVELSQGLDTIALERQQLQEDMQGLRQEGANASPAIRAFFNGEAERLSEYSMSFSRDETQLRELASSHYLRTIDEYVANAARWNARIEAARDPDERAAFSAQYVVVFREFLERLAGTYRNPGRFSRTVESGGPASECITAYRNHSRSISLSITARSVGCDSVYVSFQRRLSAQEQPHTAEFLRVLQVILDGPSGNGPITLVCRTRENSRRSHAAYDARSNTLTLTSGTYRSRRMGRDQFGIPYWEPSTSQVSPDPWAELLALSRN